MIKNQTKTEKQKKNSRPRKATEKKSERMNVMGTAEQKIKIKARADLLGMTISSFLLRLGLGRKILPPPPAVNRKMLLEINVIGRNLNTLVVLLQKNRNFNAEAISITMEDLREKILEINKFLIGITAYETVEEVAEPEEKIKVYFEELLEEQRAAVLASLNQIAAKKVH